jgi:hypothetical protein
MAVMFAASRSAPVPRPGNPLGQLVTIRHSIKPLETAGAAKAAPLPSTAALSNDLRFTRDSSLDDAAHGRHTITARVQQRTAPERQSLDTADPP